MVTAMRTGGTRDRVKATHRAYPNKGVNLKPLWTFIRIRSVGNLCHNKTEYVHL